MAALHRARDLDGHDHRRAARREPHRVPRGEALEVLGDWWTLLVIREAFTGARRFADFEQNLGISKNVLAQRLAHLVANGVFERVDVGRHGIHYEYALAPRGRDLATVMTALRQWGDRWVFGEGHEPLVVRDRRTGRPIPPLRIRGDDGEPLSARDMEIVLGPGASPRTVERYRRASRTPKSPSQRSTPR